MRKEFTQKKLMEILQIFGERRLGFFYSNDAFTLCEYSVETGELVHCNGRLLSRSGIDVSDSLSTLVGQIEKWPIEEDLRKSSDDFFKGIATGYISDNVNLCSLEILLHASDKDRWMNVCAMNLVSSGKNMVELLFIVEDRKKANVRDIIANSASDELTNASLKDDFVKIVDLVTADNSSHGFLLVDFDELTKINNMFGKEVGDKALHDAIDRLHNGLRSDDIIGRTDGDEFMICLYGIDAPADLLHIANHVLKMIQIDLPANFSLTASIGAVLSPDGGNSYAELYKNASDMLAEVKKSGGNDCFLYVP